MTHRLVTIEDVLATPHLSGATVLAGGRGVHRTVSSVNVMENPDILPWVKADELLLTVGYALSTGDAELEELLPRLAERGVAAVGIKLGRFLDSVDAASCELADDLGLPILALDPSTSFDDVIDAVYSSRYSAPDATEPPTSELERDLVDRALHGASSADLAARFCELADVETMFLGLGNIVLVHGPDGVEPLSAQGVEAFVDGARGAPVVAGSTYVGQLYVAGESTTIADLDAALAKCAQIMALASSRELAVAAVNNQFHSELLSSMLFGRMPEEEVRRRCQMIQWQFELPAAVVAVALPDAPASHVERIRARLQIAFSHRDLRPPLAILDEQVVAVVPSRPRSFDDVKSLFADVLGDLSEDSAARSVCVGASEQVDELDRFANAYRQATMAARVVPRVAGAQAVATFQELGAYRLLSEISAEDLETFARDALGDLVDDDDPTGLRATLDTLLANNLSIAHTAREMFFHYNTIRYRIEQLERRLGPFVNEPDRSLELRLALMITKMRLATELEPPSR